VRLVETLVVRGDDADAADVQIAFHLAAGVDFVLAAVTDADGEAAAAIDRHVTTGRALAVAGEAGAEEAELRTRLARLAVAEHGADWVLDADPDEFWWPRGESLKDALAAIPPRYGLVQGLVRLFVPVIGEGPFWERMTTRRSLDPSMEPEPHLWALRPIYRAHPTLVVPPAGEEVGRGSVPLRAWYPFEVLRFPLRDPEQAERRLASGLPPRSALEAEALDALRQGRLRERLEQLTAGGPVVEDTRLRGALKTIRDGERQLPFRAPDLVDDAAYAVECAAIREVDLPRLEREVTELEGRVAWLEQRFWPRVLRRLGRLAGRSPS
jgi:hypothetical protein